MASSPAYWTIGEGKNIFAQGIFAKKNIGVYLTNTVANKKTLVSSVNFETKTPTSNALSRHEQKAWDH